MEGLASWLGRLGLVQYAEQFEREGIDLRSLPLLSDGELAELGVLLGHRKLLLKAVAELAPTPTESAPSLTKDALHVDSSRRQLTVMFCDLVGSTPLANRLDPEDLRAAIRAYHDAVVRAVAPYEGHVAQLLGDGVLLYFGYPRAHEDEAPRAVRAAVDVIEAVHRVRLADGTALQSRIGIATGLVVVGEIGNNTPAAEKSATGETPNLAARLQAQALPGEIVVSAETRRLIGGAYELRPLGPLSLKGFANPVEAFLVVGLRSLATRFEARHDERLVRFVGRDSELALLLERWALARDGEAQVVLLSGEAGIGKSRICQTLRERVAGDPMATVLLQCSPYHASSALHPVAAHLERVAGITPTDPVDLRVQKVERHARALTEASIGSLLRLMGLPDGGRSRHGEPGEEKARTIDALLELTKRLCDQQPVLLLVEDAHWIDPTTEELIAQIADRLREARLLLLVTARPEYVAAWSSPAQTTHHTLSRLAQRQCAALVTAVADGKPLPTDLSAVITRKTDGVPLFIEELTKTVLQSGLLEETADGFALKGPLPALGIPSTLQDSLMARLDKLPQAKEIAQVAAVIGRDFPHRMLARVLDTRSGQRLDGALDELVRAELLFRRGTPPDASYSFKHALVRDAAYHSMLKSQRLQRHAQIARALEQEQSDGAAIPHELLAYHCQEGGDPQAALSHWQAAGDAAVGRSALREAVAHYRAALGVLDRARLSDRDAVELRLRSQLGSALVQVEGFASVEALACWSKARELSLALDRPDNYVLACVGIATKLSSECRFSDMIALYAEMTPQQLTRLTPTSRVRRLAGLAASTMHRGEFRNAFDLYDEARREIEHVSPQDRNVFSGGADPLVSVLLRSQECLGALGRFDQARDCGARALELAERQGHVNSRVWALYQHGWTCRGRGQMEQAIEYATRSVELAARHGLRSFGALGTLLLGLCTVDLGRVDEGVTAIREGLLQYRRVNGRLTNSAFATAAADSLLNAGRPDLALEFVLLVEQIVAETEEQYRAPEALRLRGQLFEKDGDEAAAERCYRQAIHIADQQGAKLHSLNAATRFAMLCAAQGRREEGAATLRPIFEWFTDGFDVRELVLARAALERCS